MSSEREIRGAFDRWRQFYELSRVIMQPIATAIKRHERRPLIRRISSATFINPRFRRLEADGSCSSLNERRTNSAGGRFPRTSYVSLRNSRSLLRSFAESAVLPFSRDIGNTSMRDECDNARRARTTERTPPMTPRRSLVSPHPFLSCRDPNERQSRSPHVHVRAYYTWNLVKNASRRKADDARSRDDSRGRDAETEAEERTRRKRESDDRPVKRRRGRGGDKPASASPQRGGERT